MASIAVIIPTYRPGHYFSECLASLDKQTLDKGIFKVYICLNNYRESDLSVVRENLNFVSFQYELVCTQTQGVSHARNLLIDRSTEEFVVFVDDDDVATPNYLEQLFKVASPEVMGISNIINWNPAVKRNEPNYIGQTFGIIRDGEQSKFRARKYFSSPWGKIISRSAIGQSRFDEELEIGEDSLFMAHISRNIERIVKTSADAYYIVNLRNGSSSRISRGATYEIKRTCVTLMRYARLMFDLGYEKTFIASRLLATLKSCFLRILY